MEQSLDASTIKVQVKERIRELEQQLEGQTSLLEELALLHRVLMSLDQSFSPLVVSHATRRKAPERVNGAATAGASTRTRRGTGNAPRGQNKAKILEALTSGAMTASDVSKRTGIGRGTASTTLNTLLKAGAIVKAERGYALAP